ncbi:unnamed protein product [Rotaria sordida]|uniref:Ionotropic glutamate receptor C-terminal domain-containing protein n=2 Tax=Rotaria sordida TaxID=392033 RepID=A0A814PDZ5_9BILA|nr:unnamed protein product [Rotaria sordida]
MKKAIELHWPVRSSMVKLIGFFPSQADKQSNTSMWSSHCRSMFKSAVILSQQYHITFQGQYLDYEEIITEDDAIVALDHACQKVSTSNIVGFVGPAYSNEVRILASFAFRLGILSISYSATSPGLSTIDNGAFYRINPSDENIVIGIAVLFQQYTWKSCIIIYQNDDYGYSGMKSLSHKFSEWNIKISEKIKFDIHQQNFEIDFKNTLLNDFSRIVIVWATATSTKTILNMAIKENLIGPSFIWLLSTTIALDDFDLRQKQELIGILTVEPVKADSVEVPRNITLLKEAYEIWKHYESETFPGETNVNSYALFAFDATWSLILALQQLCSMPLSCLEFKNVSNCYNHQFLNSKQYYNIMRAMTFLGVSGEVKFSNGTTDRVDNTYYMINNLQPLNEEPNYIGYLPVLKWHAGAPEWTYNNNKSDSILWPGRLRNRPSGYKLIQGQELRMAIIESPPFIILKNATAAYYNMKDNYKNISITEFDGFYKDILLYLQDKMGFSPIIMLAKPTTQYNELVEGVSRNLFDTVMSTIVINAKRKTMVDFGTPIIPHSIRIIIRKPNSVQLDPLFFLKPFSLEVWLFILATIPCTGALIWYFEPKEKRKFVTIIHTINFIIHTILDKDHSFTASTASGRFLTLGLHILQTILFAVYTASLLNYLLIQSFDPIISGIDDIKNSKIPPNRIGIVAGSHVEQQYLTTLSQDGDIDAALWINESIIYNINNIYCDLMTIGDEFGQSYYALPVRQDWLYKSALDSNIVSIIESGELDRISAKWFASHNCSNQQLSEQRKITIQTMKWGGGGCVLMIEDQIAPDQLQIETKFGLHMNLTTIIRYTCSMSDDCAWAFANELFGSKLAELDALSIQETFSNLLYTNVPNPTGVQCIGSTCTMSSYCQAKLEEIRSSEHRLLNIDNNLPCLSTLTEVNMITIAQTYSYPNTIKTNMSLTCNRLECNNISTVMQVYELFNYRYVLPLNDSILNINTSFISTTPKPQPSIAFIAVSSENIIVHIILSLLFCKIM